MVLQRYSVCTHVCKHTFALCRASSTAANVQNAPNEITILGNTYQTDDWTNVGTNVLQKLGRNLHVLPHHPLSLVRQRIVNYFYHQFHNRIGNPIFSIYDNVSPVVTVAQNFDSLLVPKDHPSRNKSDCFYVNRNTLLRAHTTAHQSEFISSGLDNFIVIGDVYRRDEIDSTHYPVFHQADAVRLRTASEVFERVKDGDELRLFEHRGTETSQKQGCHTLESVKIMEQELKDTLVGLAQTLFGADVEYKWTEEHFPFTHPSWELEVFRKNKWYEILGCGIMRQEILERCGVGERIGWAFGLGLERLAMCLYDIPDIRLFWSRDSGFLNQFKVENVDADVQYKMVSKYPQCINDISFWLPEDRQYCPNDFYDLARNIGGDIVEQIILQDIFTHPKSKKSSHCYRIVYRHMERTLSKEEANDVHKEIERAASEKLSVTIR